MKNKPKLRDIVYWLQFYGAGLQDEIEVQEVCFEAIKLINYKYNCFKTRQEAEEAKRRIIGILKGN